MAIYATQYGGLGWHPGRPHVGDKWLRFYPKQLAALPTTNARFSTLSPIWNQGQAGSCTAHGILRGYHFAAKKAGADVPMLSRLMLYFDERSIEGTTAQDAGAAISDGLATISKQGVCPESEWPYDLNHLYDAPPSQCYADAVKHEALDHAQVQVDLNQVKGVLAAGYPVIVGFTCYESLESATTAASGIVPLPGNFERQIGGHCVCLNGFWDDNQGLIGFDNSWGTSWGKSGSGFFPYQWFNQNLMSDFWVIHTTNDAVLPTPSPNPPPNPQPTPTPAPPAVTSADVKTLVNKGLQAEYDKVHGWFADGHKRVIQECAGIADTAIDQAFAGH